MDHPTLTTAVPRRFSWWRLAGVAVLSVVLAAGVTELLVWLLAASFIVLIVGSVLLWAARWVLPPHR